MVLRPLRCYLTYEDLLINTYAYLAATVENAAVAVNPCGTPCCHGAPSLLVILNNEADKEVQLPDLACSPLAHNQLVAVLVPSI